jgi:hypothetical protein
MKHAYVRCDAVGTIQICWWVDGQQGVATREVLRVGPGERAFDVPYHVWHELVGAFVDIDEVRCRFLMNPDCN